MNIFEKLGITPGPWRVFSNNIGFTAGDDDEYIDVLHSSGFIEEAYVGLEATEESKANDRLIAASPEMLEALLYTVTEVKAPCEGNCDVPNGCDCYVNRVAHAIEKATGKTWDEIRGLLED